MGARGVLFIKRDLYDLRGSETLFVKAMRENCTYQVSHCPEYAALLSAMDFSPKELTSMADLERLPPLPTTYFKRHRLSSIKPGSRPLTRVTSSGTGGVQSEVPFDLGTAWCDLLMSLNACRRHRLFSLRPTNYLILGYRPHKGNHMGVMKSAFLSTFLAPACRREYALNVRNGEYQFDMDRLVSTLQEYASSKHPVRIVGFPSYLHFLTQELKRRQIAMALPRGSMILLGGGWKQFFREEVKKELLYAEVMEQLGISEGHIHEVFSVVEHPIIYWDCPKHHFHVPIYSRVLIRDIETLEPLPNGQLGLVNLMTPMLSGAPLLSVMTDDLGILHDGDSCGCGISAPWLEVVGRVGMTDIKTCAAGAEERRQEGAL